LQFAVILHGYLGLATPIVNARVIPGVVADLMGFTRRWFCA
jgi:hypothetical protein